MSKKKNNDLIDEFLSPIQVIEFKPHVTTGELTKENPDPITIKLFNGFLEYSVSHNVKAQVKYEPKEDEVINLEPIIKEKIFKCEDQGIIPIDGLYISRVVENLIDDPDDKTQLVYKISLEYKGGIGEVKFNFSNREDQLEVYNKLIIWYIQQKKYVEAGRNN